MPRPLVNPLASKCIESIVANSLFGRNYSFFFFIFVKTKYNTNRKIFFSSRFFRNYSSKKIHFKGLKLNEWRLFFFFSEAISMRANLGVGDRKNSIGLSSSVFPTPSPAGNYSKRAKLGLRRNPKIPLEAFPSTFRGAFGRRPKISLSLSIRRGDNAPLRGSHGTIFK